MVERRGANGQLIEILEIGGQPVEVDIEIAPIVAALNAAGVPTRASCSGHGKRPANIALRDGREIIIARDHAEARKFETALSAILSTGDDAGLVERAYREGFQHARECLSEDAAFTLTTDVEEDCWRDSAARNDAAAILSLTARKKALEEALEGCEAYFEALEDAGDGKYPGMLKLIRAALNHQDNRQKEGGE